MKRAAIFAAGVALPTTTVAFLLFANLPDVEGGTPGDPDGMIILGLIIALDIALTCVIALLSSLIVVFMASRTKKRKD